MNFEAIELRQVKNGIVVLLRNNDDESEYVFDTTRKALRFIKDLLEGKLNQ